MNKKKAGRPKVAKPYKIVPVSVGVPARYRAELLATFKKLANERKQHTSPDNKES